MTEAPNIDTMQGSEDSSELKAARVFILNNITDSKDGRRCIDGRYKLNTEALGMIARPGGDFGYVMVLLTLNRELGLGMTPKQCFDAIFNIVTANGGKFYMHTDHHADPEHEGGEHHHNKPAIGCGHIAKPVDPELASAYDLDPNDLKEALEYARSRAEHDEKIIMVNLPGDHEEQGVFRILGTKKTINPQDGQAMYFVYDKTRDDDYIEKIIVPNLHIDNINAENFRKISDRQLMATVQNLAKDKPIFDVNVDEARHNIKQVA